MSAETAMELLQQLSKLELHDRDCDSMSDIRPFPCNCNVQQLIARVAGELNEILEVLK